MTTGVLTGKGQLWGGSLLRPEATGYGVVYIALHALGDLAGKVRAGSHTEVARAPPTPACATQTCVVSGSGNVAQYCVEKLIQVGARPVSMSDGNGSLVKVRVPVPALQRVPPNPPPRRPRLRPALRVHRRGRGHGDGAQERAAWAHA